MDNKDSNMKQIIAMGGGGFSQEPKNLLLDAYFLKQTGKVTPRICFIPTASGDSDNYIRRFYQSFNKLDCNPDHLSLFDPPTADLESFICERDAVYVGGGNTKNLLALWEAWELDIILKKAYNRGILLGGISAGSLCWFEKGLTDSIPGKLLPISCLGILSGSNCPHFDSELERRPTFHRLVKEGTLPGGIAADDGSALHFVDGNLSKVVSSRANAKAYKILVQDGVVKEEVLHPQLLRTTN